MGGPLTIQIAPRGGRNRVMVHGVDITTYRPLTTADAPGMLEILVASEAAEPADDHWDLVEVKETLALPALDVEGGTVAALDGRQLIGFGYLYVRAPGEKWTANLSGAVLPKYRRRGVGRVIIRTLIGQAQALRGQNQPSLAGELKIELRQGRHGAAAMAASQGFTVRRYFLDMSAELDASPHCQTSATVDGAHCRVWSPTDDESTRLAYNSAFADHWGSSPEDPQSWRKLYAQSPAFRPALSRVAVRGHDVVSFVLVMEFDSETAARGYRSGYLDRIGTVPAARGRGIATALLDQTLTALKESGFRSAELGVDADSPTGAGRLYQRAGFTVQHRNEVVGLDF